MHDKAFKKKRLVLKKKSKICKKRIEKEKILKKYVKEGKICFNNCVLNKRKEKNSKKLFGDILDFKKRKKSKNLTLKTL